MSTTTLRLARRQFCIGLLFIWIATASPLAALDHEMLTAHMVQHLLLMTLAPPLILFGTPRKPLAYGLSAILTSDRPSLAIRTDAAIGKHGNAPGTLLVCSGRHVSCVAYSFGVYARPAIANVARHRASIVSCNRTSVLVAGRSATTTKARNGQNRPYSCICFWLPCRAIFFRDFWCSAIGWFTRCFCRPPAPLASLLWKTSNAPVR
jgi:hypothetical protein